MKKFIIVLTMVAAMVAAFILGAVVQSRTNSTATITITSNLRESGEETVLIETVEGETTYWEEVETEAWD